MVGRDIDSLMIDLTCDDVVRCQTARRSLVEMGSAAVPALIEALSSKKKWVRWEAAKALSQIGDPSATDALVNALTDEEFDVRWLAAEGLVTIGRRSVAPLLKALIARPDSIWLREGAHHVLYDIERGNWHTLLKPVMNALDDMQAGLTVPIESRKALEKIHGRSGSPA